MSHNFFQNIYESLTAYQDQELIIWPAIEKGKAAISYTGTGIKKSITSVRQALEREHLLKGQMVLLAVPVGFDLICSLLAVMATGAVPVLPPARVSKIALIKLIYTNNIKCILIVAKPSLLFQLLAKALNIKLLLLNQVAESSSARWLPPIPVSPEQPALISHSSGSTGKPKAIYRSHRVLQAQHQVLKEIFPPFPSQRDFPLFPNILLHNLSLGVTSVLPDLQWHDLTQLDAERIVAQINQQQIHTITGNLFYFRKLNDYLKQQHMSLPHVQAVGIGGSPITESLVHELKEFFPQAMFYIIYGSSEAEPIAVRKVGTQKEAPSKGYAVGKVHNSLEYQIEAIGQIALAGGMPYAVGEIKVRGAHVAASDSEGWLRTGDFGYIDKENILYLTGRKGNEQLHEGVQHYQVEHVLLHQHNIVIAAAIATENGFDIYIEGTAKEKEIRKALREHFPAKIIQQVFIRDHLPVDARHHSKLLYSIIK